MSSVPSSIPIAIVGVATELPGGSHGNLDFPSFWQFLLDKKESYETIPPERFNIHTLKGHGMNQVITDTGSFLKDLNMFDNLEFGVTNKDARLMALSGRKLLELSFLALLDSGIDYRGRNVGSFMTGVPHDIVSVSGHDDSEIRSSFAFIPSMVANRVAYHLDLRGPSIPTDTACSSSLTALHLACQSIRTGECEAAVVGGSQLNHRFMEWLYYSQVGVLAPDGKCKPFDKNADGFSRGEGVVAVVLKPLDAAIRDHDKIYGTVVGTGINNCGSLMPIYAPVASAQALAMDTAFKMAGRHPTEIDFIELHATGTARGDPTEANWVGDMFKRNDELLIGSLKGNFGHLEITAFLASLAKVCGMFTTGIVPPNVNLNERNPDIHWDEYKFRVPLEPERIPCRHPNGRPLVALTSSGVGGANGSVVVEGPPVLPPTQNNFWLPGAEVPALLMAGGLTPRSAGAVGDQLKELAATNDIQNLARIYGRRARSMTWRSFAIANENKLARFSQPALAPRTAPPLVFVFSGQGPQHFNMGRELFKTNAVFKKTVLELDAVHTKAAGYSLIERYGLFDDRTDYEKLGSTWPIRVTLPGLAILHLALYETLVSAGLKPDAVLGHSAGETAVLYASGSGSKELVVELAVARGKAMSLMEDKDGTMAAVSCSPEDAQKFIDEVIAELGPGALEVGCYNTPDAVTLSGPGPHIDLAVAKADAAGIFARRLRTCVPVHSTMMGLCGKEYEELSAEVFSRYSVQAPTTAVYSTKTGEYWNEPFTSEYYWDSTRGPVMFTQAMQKVTEDLPGATYVEIGPHPVLSSYLQSLAGKDSTVTCPLKRAKAADQKVEVQGLLDTLGKVTVAGHNTVDFNAIYAGTENKPEPYASFPFAKKDFPYLSQTPEVIRQRQARNGPLNYAQLQVNSRTHLSLADHIINNEPIMPAGGYIEAALEYGAKKLWNVEFTSMLSLSSEKPIPLNVNLDGSKWTVSSAASGTVWPINYNRIHASGYLSTEADSALDETPLNIKEIQARLAPVDMTDFYTGFSYFAQYGPTYQRVVAVNRGTDAQGRDEVIVEIRGRADDLEAIGDYKLHPAILDAALHVSQHPILTGYGAGPYYYLPSKVGVASVHERLSQSPFPEKLFAHGVLTKWSPGSIVYDFTLTDAEGAPLLTIEGLEVARIGTVLTKATKRFEIVEQPCEFSVQSDAVPQPIPESHVVLEYARGEEITIQEAINKLDAQEPQNVWLVASAGFDGDALPGFARALRKEYTSWTIRSAVFDASWTPEQRTTAVQYLYSRSDVEEEIYIDSTGAVSVPRVSLASAPALRTSFSAEKPWVFEKSKLKQISAPQPSRGHVQVQVTAANKTADNAWSYIGNVAGTSRRVVGVSTGPLSNVIVAHKASVVDLPAGRETNAVAWAVSVLAMGGSHLMNEERLQEKSVVVTHADTEVGKEIAHIYNQLGAQVSTLASKPTASDLNKVAAQRPQVIVSAATTSAEIEIFDNLLAPGGKQFAWRHEKGLSQALASDPWSVGDAIKFGVESQIKTHAAYSAPVDLVPASDSEVEYQPELFSADKVYLLLGGISGLGLGIVQWMYQKGARHIIATSPSGREEVTKSASSIPRRLLSFLESIPDLSLETVALDAVSSTDLQSLIARSSRPLGGCMIISAPGASQPFSAHSEETFEASFPQTVGAFETLEQTISIEGLDFLITFSTIAGTFGAAGQTSYASANSALAALSKKYKNTFSFVAPTVLGSTAPGEDSDPITLTSAEVCGYIEDGLLKIQQGPVGQYVPAFNWDLVNASAGSSTIYNDLVTKKSDDDSGAGQEATINLRELICQTLDVPPEDLSDDVPLTQYGLDSLSAAFLSYQLAPFTTISQIQLLADVTLHQLEERLGQDPSQAPPEETEEEVLAKKIKAMYDMAEKYSTNFVCNASKDGRLDENHKTILLTGSTGSVGSHMLARLLKDDRAVKVYAFMRKQPAGDSVNMERQTAAFVSRGLDTELLKSSKLVLLGGDLTAPNLGLSEEVYNQLSREVTHIAHIGWTVNLVIPLQSFETDIRGLRALTDLALSPSGRPPMKLAFASTAGIFRDPTSDPEAPFREAPILDVKIAVGSGYAESKWVVERILAIAAEKTPLRPTSIRVHQLTGGINGAWRTQEWFPGMAATSVALGAVPVGAADDMCVWLPADYAAAGVIDMLETDKFILHLCHPKPVPFSALMDPIAKTFGLGKMPYLEWVAKLAEESAKVNRGEIKASKYLEPGIRLLGTYQSAITPENPAFPRTDAFGLMYKVSGKEGTAASPVLSDPNLPQVGEKDVLSWIGYWRSIGFLPSA